ncbi:MAG: Golgi membrane (Coy1) [Lasallia pustulata]|uniref:Protein CASP n=1 Tax=Lasallia pustulata TaxID=136370 RepID=A0A5M8PUI1_9LECA|nr:MAG: Golgi membrane (Coy1) [Lasallia pustulata]
MDVVATAESRASHDSGRDGVTDSSRATPGATTPATALGNGQTRSLDDENKFQRAIAAWRNIDLTKLVPELDNTASDIVSHQRDALIQRKDLAQKTKDFRKLDDAAKLGEFKGLLKAYQGFIDLLTNHGKTTSSAFLQLYSSVSEAPDPYPLLEASVDSLLITEDTLPKITLENEHLQKSISRITQQLEATEQQLEEERNRRKDLEVSQESRSKEIEASWQAVIDEKKDNWEAKERSLEGKLEKQERLLNEIKASYEVAQRLGRSDDGDDEGQRGSASAAELEIVSSELERTSHRLAEVEARNEQLRLELAQSSSQSFQRPAVEDDPAFSRLQSENTALLRKLDAAKLERDTETRKWDGRLRAVEKGIQVLQREREDLRKRIQQWSDYPEIKRELEVFKSIEFSTGDDDELDTEVTTSGQVAANSSITSNGAIGKDKKDTLEQLLLARNKKLGDEMAVLRVSHQQLQQQVGELQETLSSNNAELERCQNLNATLENDLSRVQEGNSNNFPSSAMSTTGTYTSRYPSYAASSFAGRRGRASPTSSIISGFDPHNNSQNTLEAIRAGEPVGGGSGILPMVQAQRDRFKQKNSQLEEELSKQYSTVSTLRQEIASLQKDNLNLYEKTRYVSTYNRGQQSSSATAYSRDPYSTAIQMPSDRPSSLSLDRYRSAYESNISPFAAFRGRETSRAYKRMSLPERIVFSITRMVLANRTSRNLFAAYCLTLHVLIFVMLYWMQTVDIEKHASNLGEAAAVAVAGGGGFGNNAGAAAHHGDWHQEGFHAEPI